MSKASQKRWTSRDAVELYGVREWSGGFFDVSEQGHLLVNPRGSDSDASFSLMEIVAGLSNRGLTAPLLLRFGDILASRVGTINEAFHVAMTTVGYQACYRGVYPIKVNQQQQVVQEIAEFGRVYHHGFEVGSKAELIAALAYLNDQEAYLVCNGYKDEAFIRLALCAQKLGLNTFLVIEMASELPTILKCAEELGVEPQLGVRAKLASRAGGLWNESGGDRSSFGLTASETIRVVDALRNADKLHCLRMLHYHLGSQIPNIQNIRTGAQEASRFYVDLVKEGAQMRVLDIGGGLAVDYDGSQTNCESSSNYGIDEYCTDIIESVMAITDDAGVAHPVIVSESGRATVAYHSVLVFNVLDACRIPDGSTPSDAGDEPHEFISLLEAVQRDLGPENLQESYHDAAYYRDQVRSLFMHGQISLRERAVAEGIFWAIASRVARLGAGLNHVPEEIRDLEAATSDVYYGNFSVFQSVPDAWTIGQLFPIMPIHRLNERPTCHATLADITCDCDGKIDHFIALHDVNRTLPLHQPTDQDYYLGVFLVGAYQETLGDLHNLLGDTNVIGLRVDDDGDIEFTREIQGDSVADVLSYAEYEPRELIGRVVQMAERALRRKRITPKERREIVETYEAGMRGYTYFERE